VHFSVAYFQFYSYNPVTHTGRQETVNINRSLKKRYYLIQKAKDAKVVGIIVGTLGVGDYLSVVDRLKSVIKQAGKKCYLFVVGKLNPAKLANFMEIDVFVVVAAAESSLIESQDFYRPILTPYELEIACGCHQWTGDYITDCTQLPDVSHVDIQSQSDGDFEPEFSLITGSLKTTDITDSTVGYVDGNLQAIAKRDPMKVAIMQSTGAQFLSERSWKGLEQRLGDTPASHAVRGRRGVAIAYEDEPQT
jgi:diphthamide biosynthesis protein 2